MLMVVTNCSLTGFFLPHTHSAEPSPPPCSHQQMKLTNEPRDCSTSPQPEPQPQVNCARLGSPRRSLPPQGELPDPQLCSRANSSRAQIGGVIGALRGGCLRVEESLQGEKHLGLPGLAGGPTARGINSISLARGQQQPARLGSQAFVWLASVLLLCYHVHLPLFCQMSGFCTSCFFCLDPTSSAPSLQGLFSESRKAFQIPPIPRHQILGGQTAPEGGMSDLRRKVRLEASGVTSGHFLLRATRAGQRGGVPRKRKRVGDRKVKWILLRHPLLEEPSPAIPILYPALPRANVPGHTQA